MHLLLPAGCCGWFTANWDSLDGTLYPLALLAALCISFAAISEIFTCNLDWLCFLRLNPTADCQSKTALVGTEVHVLFNGVQVWVHSRPLHWGQGLACLTRPTSCQ
jgi:hypothetical protein